jgi:hypothetical protein
VKNPFRENADGTDPVKDALDAEDAEEVQDPEEQPDSKLFDGPDEDEEVEEEVDEDSALFDAEEPEDEGDQIPKGWTKGTYNRFTQVIGQRNELRTQSAQKDATIKTLQDAVESHKGIVGVISEKYGKFENPAAMVAADAAFMDAVEELGKTNPEVARFGAAIQNFLRTGEVPKMADGTQPAPPAPATTPAPETKPAEDPRITKIIEGNARKSIKETLAGLDVKASFRDIIADHVVKQDELDLTNLSETKVVEIAKAFIKDKGFTPEDVLQKVVEGKGSKKAKTTGKAGVSTKDSTTRERGGKGKDTGPKAPKDIDEWNAQREERRAAFIRESLSD